jgi:hypothetical protein
MDGPVSGNKQLALDGDVVLRLSVLDEWHLGGGSTGKLMITHRARLTLYVADAAKRQAATW